MFGCLCLNILTLGLDTVFSKFLSRGLLLIALATYFPMTAFAVPDVTDRRGWSGFIGVGLGYTRLQSNSVAGNRFAKVENDTISNITDKPDVEDDAHYSFTGEITYTFRNRHQFFVGTSLEDLLTFDGASQLGWRKTTDSTGTFQLGVLASRLWPPEVYADPYQTGTPRAIVDRESLGVRFQWGKILDTPLEWSLTYREIVLDSESSGAGVPSCDKACQATLDRNGDFYENRLSWLFRPGGAHLLRPLLGYRKQDLKGGAASHEFSYLQLSYSYIGSEFRMVSNVLAGRSDFEQVNPLYGTRQDGRSVLLDTTLFYLLPFASKRWSIFGSISWGQLDSDIDFHDTEVFSALAGILFKFGKYSPDIVE